MIVFKVVKLMDQFKPAYMIIETFPTSDGIRSRLCNGVHDSELEARADVLRREQERKSDS